MALSTTRKLLLFVALPLALLLVAGGILVALLFRSSGPVDIAQNVQAGSRIAADVPGATLVFQPSNDGQVHIRARGAAVGPKPTISVDTSGDVTTISGRGCLGLWFTFCSLTVTVQMPDSLPLVAKAENGGVSATGLTGKLELTTTNGNLSAAGTHDQVELRTTNGAIRVTASESERLSATTTNGTVDLDFSAAPESVEAQSTNGGITVRVPEDDESYFVDATTTNGNVDTRSINTSRTAERTITAKTTNGAVTVTTR